MWRSNCSHRQHPINLIRVLSETHEKLDTARSTSILALSSVLPWSMLSHTANNSRLSAMMSLMRRKRRERSARGVLLHAGKAFLAALIAASTSSADAQGMRAMSFPDLGSNESMCFDEVAVMNLFSEKCCRVSGLPSSCLRRVLAFSRVLADQISSETVPWSWFSVTIVNYDLLLKVRRGIKRKV